MNILLDTTRCTGHAQCYAFGPKVYDLDDAGYCALLVAEVPADLESQAVDGAQACPEQALTITG